MKNINHDSLAEIVFEFDWNSAEAAHTERYCKWVNFWRDILPEEMTRRLLGAEPGHRVEHVLPSGQGLADYDPGKLVTLKPDCFDAGRAKPCYGRFYPLGKIRGLYNIYPENIRPFRCVGVETDAIRADMNHPLAGHDLKLTAVVGDAMRKPYDRGGECTVIMDCVTDGPGMQARWNGAPTDFFSPHAFNRPDETEDDRFYAKPRLVNHIDDKAIATISDFYGQLMRPGMDVLDLMSSWRSHVPASAGYQSLTGLGMNAEEMAANPQLTGYKAHDLNARPKLPFDDQAFDLVICTVSVEYLIRPAEVFADVARILRPGGVFAVTFSNRWFPPKAVNIWPELHEFERMGLVMEYFHHTGLFADLHTLSARGWPRPETDKYYPRMRYSDPVYGVWGRVSSV
jgi:SAM-dependent methyltransferase/FKBP-type peptidyl-prolyl cis-trans isomerase 2